MINIRSLPSKDFTYKMAAKLKSTQRFYEKLIAHRTPAKSLLKDKRLFKKIPETWFVVVADIAGSTEAVANGKHNEVNISATGAIIAVLNEIQEMDKEYKIPYFFGGDGATFMIPQQLHKSVMTVLEHYKGHVKEIHDLDLKVGSMSVKSIYAENHNITIAKIRLNDYLIVPIVLGTGLKYAERCIKDAPVTTQLRPNNIQAVNLTGMECRWDEIQPRALNKKVICLLVTCSNDRQQAEVYREVLERIDRIFGNLEERQPISTPKLILDTTIGKIKKEMYARIGKFDLQYLLKNWFITRLGSYYFKYFKDGQEYLKKVSSLSDTFMIDGTINTVMEGDEDQVKKLNKYLTSQEEKGRLRFGIHVTYASIMSCYVQDRDENHIHFVDGTEGGYTAAATLLKQK